jgi:hypothetical protein
VRRAGRVAFRRNAVGRCVICGRRIVADFLSRPDSYDTHCADTMQPPTFVS